MLKDAILGSERPKSVEVECPEFPDDAGAPTTLRFRSRLTVADVLALSAADDAFKPLRFELLLFHLLALDEQGERLDDPDADDWFKHGADPFAVIAVVRRAGVVDTVIEQLQAHQRATAGRGAAGGKRRPSAT